jgi:hypothetical protein
MSEVFFLIYNFEAPSIHNFYRMKMTFISVLLPSAPLPARCGGGRRDAIRPLVPEGGGRKGSGVRRVGD